MWPIRASWTAINDFIDYKLYKLTSVINKHILLMDISCLSNCLAFLVIVEVTKYLSDTSDNFRHFPQDTRTKYSYCNPDIDGILRTLNNYIGFVRLWSTGYDYGNKYATDIVWTYIIISLYCFNWFWCEKKSKRKLTFCKN